METHNTAYWDNKLRYKMHLLPNDYRDVLDFRVLLHSRLRERDVKDGQLDDSVVTRICREAINEFTVANSVSTAGYGELAALVDFHAARVPFGMRVQVEFAGQPRIERTITEVSGVRSVVECDTPSVALSLPLETGVMNPFALMAVECAGNVFSLQRKIGDIGAADVWLVALWSKADATYRRAEVLLSELLSP